jgi:hypothetical protein
VKLLPEGGLLTWEQARQAAAGSYYLGAQGHLATVASAAENSFIVGLIPQDDLMYKSTWLGGYETPSHDWEWVTGEPFDYTNWKAGEPNGWLYGDPPNHLVMYSGVVYPPDAGLWNDYNDVPLQVGFRPYVVEYIPEPASVVLLALGGLALARGRRRRRARR